MSMLAASVKLQTLNLPSMIWRVSLLDSGASLMAQQWRICLQCKRYGFDPWIGKIPRRRIFLILLSALLKCHMSDCTHLVIARSIKGWSSIKITKLVLKKTFWHSLLLAWNHKVLVVPVEKQSVYPCTKSSRWPSVYKNTKRQIYLMFDSHILLASQF